MKTFFFLTCCLLSMATLAEESADTWQSSVLTEATMMKIQSAKMDYKKCVAEKMQNKAYLEMDSRKATEDVVKQCEPTLSKMREVYIAEKVPGVIADRHLKQLRTQTIRTVLQELMFSQANRIPE